MFSEPQSVIYPTNDLAAATAWYQKVLNVEPYFNQHPYVGFSVNGFELGLFELADLSDGPRTYWGVNNAQDALDELVALGATIAEEVHDVGGGIQMASVTDPEGNHVGLIENPTFSRS